MRKIDPAPFMGMLDAFLKTHPEKTGFSHQNSPPLQGRFTYLGKGRQCYVFSSTDGKMVLKLYRYHLLFPSMQERLYGFFFGTPPKKDGGRLENYLTSCLLAESCASQQSGLIAFHLPESSCKKRIVTICDRLGRMYPIDLSKQVYVLQKQGIDLGKQLQEELRMHNKKRFFSLVDAYLRLQVDVRKKGLENQDPCPLRNAGYLPDDGTVFDLDIGRYVKKDPCITQKQLHASLVKSSSSLRRMLERLRPSWLQELSRSIDATAKKGL